MNIIIKKKLKATPHFEELGNTQKIERINPTMLVSIKVPLRGAILISFFIDSLYLE